MTATTITILAEKGGVGKSSIATNLAGHYAIARGKRCLLVDTDRQASVSKLFLKPAEVKALPKSHTVAALLDDRCLPTAEELFHPTGIEGLSLLPASPLLKEHNVPNTGQNAPLQFALRDFLQEVGEQFDYVFIDTPPDVANLPTAMALMASDFVITPILPELFSIQAIAGVDEVLAEAQDLNPSLGFLGYVVNKRRGGPLLHKAMEDRLRAVQRDRVFAAVLPDTISFAEAQIERLPIDAYDASSVAAKKIKALAEEVDRRIAQETKSRRAA